MSPRLRGAPRQEAERSRAWDAVATALREPQFQEQLALYKRRETLDLIAAWAGVTPAGRRPR